jgi:hypothetical protein
LGTLADENQAKRGTTAQEEQGRINKIDDLAKIDTVEVIGSIPVAPTEFEVVSSAYR